MSSRSRLLHPGFSRPISRLALVLMLVTLAMPTMLAMDGFRSASAEEPAATPSASEEVVNGEAPNVDPVDEAGDVDPEGPLPPAPTFEENEEVTGDVPDEPSVAPDEPESTPSMDDADLDDDVAPASSHPEESTEASPQRQMQTDVADAALDEGIGTIFISKLNQFGSPLAGAAFELRQGGIVVDTWVSSAYDGHLVTGLHLDIPYTVHETSAPAGCVAGADHVFTLTPDVPSDAVSIMNDCAPPVPGAQLTITKINQTGSLLGGAQFELIQGGSVVERWVSTRFGGHTISGLMFDVPYTIREVAAPAGCTGVADQTVTVTLDNPAPTVTLRNECSGSVPTGEIAIHKTDQNGNLLAGVEFLAMDGPWVMARATTAADGWINFMRLPLDATYTIREVAPLAGCLPAEDSTVTLDASHTFQLFEIVNQCPSVDARGEVIINNIDQDGVLLGAVEFQVLRGDGTIARIGAMPWSGLLTFSGLDLDEPYTIHIVAAPEGCAAAPDQALLLTAAEPRQDMTFINECTDPALEAGTISIQVKDQDSLPLPGVRLQLQEAGTGILEVTSGTSVVRFDGLTLDVPYTVHVVSVPAGCELAPDQTLTLTAENPSRAMAFLIDCDEGRPSPTPSDPASTPVTSSTPGASLTEPETGTIDADPDTRAASPGIAASQAASIPMVHALPNTGQGVESSSGHGLLALLAASGALGLLATGMRLRRT